MRYLLIGVANSRMIKWRQLTIYFMKNKNIFLSLIVILLFSSCSVKNYYQVFKTHSKDSIVNNGSSLVYADENCLISYNFWSDGGNMNFIIQNNSDKNIYLNKKECFFICNGYAYDYFQDRTYTTSEGVQTGKTASKSLGGAAGVSVSGINSFGYNQTNSIAAAKNYAISYASVNSTSSSISWEEPQIICIPSKSSKVISEFGKITNSLIRNCELYRYPTDTQTNSSFFSETDSPLVFCNKLAYYLENSKELIRINNEFYVSEITNLTEKNMISIESKREEFCGDKGEFLYKEYWINSAPDKFYIKYKSSMDDTIFKH